jgi:hypothetical protein
MTARRSPSRLVLAVRAALALAFLGGAAASSLSGCQAIAGIEDRYYEETVDSGGGGDGGGGTDSPACKSYCSDVMKNCTGENAVYGSETACLAVCTYLPPGDPEAEAQTGNTLACRAAQARAAGLGEPEDACPKAGPGGGTKCGPDCVSYCYLLPRICPANEIDDCESKCAALIDSPGYDLKVNHDNDTLECRILHTSNSSLDPEGHCWHAAFSPRSRGVVGTADFEKNPCANPIDEEPTCGDYCRINLVACQGELAVFESKEQCMAVCAALPKGKNADIKEDTVGCRVYHSYNSMVQEAADHCPHSGPGGDGHCGVEKPNCPSYCILAKTACETEYAAKYATDAECQAACEELPGAPLDSGYTVATAPGEGTVQALLLCASRALTDDTFCPAALGDAPCPAL